MPVVFKNYTSTPGFTPEYERIHRFLLRLNDLEVVNEGFLWGRWEWMFSLPYLDTSCLHTIGIWEDAGKIVAVATFEQKPGDVWLCVEPEYAHLKQEMLQYAMQYLSEEGKVRVLIADNDRQLQQLAAGLGFRPTQEREYNAVIPIGDSLPEYTLPEGYRIVSLAEELDLRQYNRVLWRGFNHEGEAPEAEEKLESRRNELSGPHGDLNLKIAVAAPNGNFVAYCGMWHLPGNDYALVEPVATDPDYRMKGLGKAAVMEGVRRCGERGAKQAFVGSSQQFYYSIGFRPYSTWTWWKYSGH